MKGGWGRPVVVERQRGAYEPRPLCRWAVVLFFSSPFPLAWLLVETKTCETKTRSLPVLALPFFLFRLFLFMESWTSAMWYEGPSDKGYGLYFAGHAQVLDYSFIYMVFFRETHGQNIKNRFSVHYLHCAKSLSITLTCCCRSASPRHPARRRSDLAGPWA